MGTQIAIVHRDIGVVRVLEMLSQRLGHDVTTLNVDRHTTSQQVASFVEEHQPGLVLLAENYQGLPSQGIGQSVTDVKRGEGIDALILIRETHPTLPIVMVSGSPLHEDRALANGANDYLILPVGFDDYARLLNN